MGRASPDLLDPARYAFACELQTRFSDMDVNRHINNVAIAAAFEDARVRFDRVHADRSDLPALRLLIVAAQIDYLAEAHYPAPFVIHGAVIAIGRTSWTMAQLAMQGDRACAFNRAVIASTEGGRPAPLPGALRERLGRAMIAPAR